ncbi:MoaD/ThiS family protein [Chitinimonas koreensis]|uniref:MoaD/ThiS family protein n=1 Tax=Chitinimonas koreensis TaxID=356302 RepID=UPI0003FAEBA6|nr:MoaD/ThiS family protein [Chitinimonas koreensis]QNM95309.1 MoaD/ThiS family protein [Chitinimonas koreensis]
MPITLSIPTVMRSLTQDQRLLDASGQTVLEVIDHAEARYPGLKARLVNDGQVHRYVNIYVNDDDIRFAAGLATPVRDGDSLTILPAVAGGAPA